MNRHVHIEVTRIEGRHGNLGIATPPTLHTEFEINGVPASVSGVCQFNGMLYAIASLLALHHEINLEIADKIRAMWRDLRILFTGYWTGWVDGYREQR